METWIRRAYADELEGLKATKTDSAWSKAAFEVWEAEHNDSPVLVWDETDLARRLSGARFPLDPEDIRTFGSPLVWLIEFASLASRDEFIATNNWRDPGEGSTADPTEVAARLSSLAPSPPLPAASAYSSAYADALAFAAIAHAEHTKKSTTVPYLPHLLRVSARVWTEGGSEDQAIGALLHDTIEDVGNTVAPLIEERFGATVLAIVEACTDTDQPDRKPPFLDRKLEYMEHLASLRGDGLEALLVSAADKLDNLDQILDDLDQDRPEVWARFKGGRVGTVWYHRTVVQILQGHGALLPRHLVTALDARVNELASRAARD